MPDDRRLTLVVPSGAAGYPISWGTTSYAPYREDIENPASRWLVKVPPEAAIGLLNVGGFFMVDSPQFQVPHGFALVRHATDPKASASVGEPDGHGNLIVPNDAVEGLKAHGFVAIDCEQAPPVALSADERDRALAQAAARVMDLEQRLSNAGSVVTDLTGERDALKARVAELEHQLAAATAPKPEPAPKPAEPAPAPAAAAPAAAAGAPAADKSSADQAPADKPDAAVKPAAAKAA